MPIIQKSDLPIDVQSNDQVDIWVKGANAQAVRVAPCLSDTADPSATEGQFDEALMVLVGAVMRWSEAGTGVVQQQMAGPFSVLKDTSRPRSGFRLWPTEIQQLQDICGGSGSAAFSIDTVPSDGTIHADICSVNAYVDDQGNTVYGGAYCSCGADIAGVPLYEV